MVAHVLYLVIEHLRDTKAVDERLAATGRGFDEWFAHWSDPGSIEVHPVLTSAEAASRSAST